MSEPILHLASSSARRRDILTALGLHFTFAGVGIDESPRDGESAENLVLRLAREKALAARKQDRCGLPVLAADTVVVAADRILGKPMTETEALAMLALLSAAEHRVMTAVALLANEKLTSTMSVTCVRFREISPVEALMYWQSGEAADKAGAYAIQGVAGIFVESLSGSYSGVVGLPVFETAALLRAGGIDVLATAASLAVS
jgi:septum formation protein